jgi:ComF family protein
LQCFGNKTSSSNICEKCISKDSLFRGVAAAFDYSGAPATLIKRLKHGSQPYLAKGAGAFLVAQWAALKWPIPDLIIPVPQKFFHWLDRGFNQSELLAEFVGELLSKPVVPILSCSNENFSQTGLSRKQRQNFQQKIKIKKTKEDLSDKVILLIDDVMTTGSTFHACAEALLQACPASIYALAVCHARSLR